MTLLVLREESKNLQTNRIEELIFNQIMFPCGKAKGLITK